MLYVFNSLSLWVRISFYHCELLYVPGSRHFLRLENNVILGLFCDKMGLVHYRIIPVYGPYYMDR